MSLPADWTQIRVTGTYLLRDGSVPWGSVVFSSPQIVLADDKIVLPQDIVAPLDGNGAIDVLLPATNDPDVQPSGWAYWVTENVGECAGRHFAMAVDAAGGDIDLATVAPVVPPPLMGALAAYNLTPGTITTLDAGALATVNIHGALPNQIIDIGVPRGLDGTGVGGGISQAQADARYIQKAGGNEDDVITKRSGDAVWAAPAIPWASTNW